MSILDDYNELTHQVEKESILKVFKDIDMVDIPAAYKAWADVFLSHILDPYVKYDEKSLIVDLCRQCNFNHRIYVRDLNEGEYGGITIIETWTNNNRMNDYLKSWSEYLLTFGLKYDEDIKLNDIFLLICGFIGYDPDSNQSWIKSFKDEGLYTEDYYAYAIEPISFNQLTTTYLTYEPTLIKSKYRYYINLIYQLLDLYKIKKES